MYRILVIDDEAYITDGLAYMFEELREPVLEVSKAYSATEALAFLNKHAVDIVVTDIQMPGMSGIDMIKEIRIKWPDCRVIFLTGYDDFDYARQAIKLGASNYILKNEGDDVLVDAVRRCIRSIEEKSSESIIPEKTSGRRKSTDYLRSIVIGERPERNSFRETLQSFDLQLNSEDRVMLLIGKVGVPVTKEVLQSTTQIIRSRVGYALNCEGVDVDKRLILWLVQPAAGGNFEHAQAAVKGFAEQIQDACVNQLGIRISMIFDSDAVEWENLPRRFAYVFNLINEKWEDDYDIAMASVSYLENDTLQEGSALPANQVTDGGFLIQKINQYISDHLNEDLSLTRISDYLSLNPSYVSRRYKQLTGNNLKDMILQDRMERAKSDLRSSTERIGKIAENCGFDSAAHFSRVFRSYEGKSPQDYRNNL